ncbi:hypothetical protein U9M48_042003 [Paspalum notatum var. saurae]|uniref:Uncharacterized protein n=1 Tax=Paspalum notatum var. saurae TaxID=547442 RepID=A0AAQ3UU85_PASNO
MGRGCHVRCDRSSCAGAMIAGRSAPAPCERAETPYAWVYRILQGAWRDEPCTLALGHRHASPGHARRWSSTPWYAGVTGQPCAA